MVAVTVALALAWLWISQRDILAEHHRKRTRRGQTRALALLLVLAFVLTLASRLDWVRDLRKRVDRGETVAGQSAPNNRRKPPAPATTQTPEFKWLPVFVATGAGLTLLGFFGLRAARRARADLLEPYLLERELEALLDDTLEDLHAERDPRKAIIGAYARMERLFATYGLPRRPNEAPMEYLDRTLGELRASASALRRLTALFQWAKFSHHEVDATMRSEAIEALTRVRDELKANRQEDELRREQARQRQQDLADADPASDRTFGDDPFKSADEKAKGSIYGRAL